MNQQYPYPDGPGYGSPQSGHDPVPTASYDLEPQPGYDPTSSMPVMGGAAPPPQQSGYGPPAAGGMPPPMQPKKSSAPLIIGLVVGVVALLGIAGVGVWFFLLGGSDGGGPGGGDSADGRQEVFPASHTVTEKAPPDGETWEMSKPESYDKCVDLNLEPVKSVLPLDGNPEGETTPDDETTGMVSCRGAMAGEANEDNYRPTGSFYVDFIAAKDAKAASETHGKIWDVANGFGESEQLDITEDAESRTKLDNNVLEVAVAFRVGNVSGLARMSLNFSTHFAEPDRKMMTDVLTDVIYSGLN